jgi:hypothetical protein
VVYTYLDDFGSRVVAFVTTGKRARLKATAKGVVEGPEAVPTD